MTSTYIKNYVNLSDLLSIVKRFCVAISMQFVLDTCLKVTLKKGSLVKSKNIIMNINAEIIELEQNKI